MNRSLPAVLLAYAVALGGTALADESEKAPQGKEVFAKHRCQSCHSVQSEGIKKTGTTRTAKRAPDLSGVGLERDHEWIEKFLLKEEKIEDRVHPMTFKGTKDEREYVAAWLETLKTPKEAKKSKESKGTETQRDSTK